MRYVRLYTELLTHEKQLATSDRAWRALTLAIVYAGKNETDGHVPDYAQSIVRFTPNTTKELEALGWIHRNGQGWIINDWADHQETTGTLAASRAKAAERARRSRERKGNPGD